MRSCIVPFCKNKGTLPNVQYFCITQKRFETWMTALGRSTNERIDRFSSICSDHFLSKDFIFGPAGKKTLLPMAVPSQNLRPSQNRWPIFPDSSTLELERPKIIPTEELYIVASTSHDISNDRVMDQRTSDDADSSIQRKRSGSSSSSHSQGLRVSPKELKTCLEADHSYSASPPKLKSNVLSWKNKIKQLRDNLRKEKAESKRLKKRLFHLKKIVADLRKERLHSKGALEVLEKTFSGIPLELMKRMLVNSKRGTITHETYPEDLKEFALTLQFYSSKAYNYVRRTFDFALPSQSSMRNWLSNVKCEPESAQQGIDALQLLQVSLDSERSDDEGGVH